MTHYEQPFGQTYDPIQQGPPRTSGLAIASLVCSLILCCPVVTALAGVILGFVSFVSIGRNPALRGKGIAMAGILIGVIVLGGWAGLAVWGYGVFQYTMTAPNDALTALANGDPATFRSEFVVSASSLSDKEATDFMAELERRYGPFQVAEFDPQDYDQSAAFGNPVQPYAYDLKFRDKTVNATIKIAFADPPYSSFTTKLSSITVHDPDLGDVSFPETAGQTAPEAQPAQSTDEP